MKINLKTKILFLLLSAILTIFLVVFLGKNPDVPNTITTKHIFELSKKRIKKVPLTFEDPQRKLIKETKL